MDWKKIISNLVAAKLTQREIAEYIGVTQSAISQVLSGKKSAQKGFRYEPGQRLLELHKAYGEDCSRLPPPPSLLPHPSTREAA